jgi:hypothetical protein
MRLSTRFAFAVALWAHAAAAPAVPVRGLYEASVPVPDQSAAARDPALRQALEAVLVRVTGNRLLPEPAVALVQRASVLVQGYGYEAGATGRDLRLRAQFDARAVEAALRSQGLPVWGPNRPSHIVWIALRDDGQPRAVLDAAGAAARAGALLATAEARGLPFSFPALDVTDRQLVTFNEIWRGNLEGVQGASRRYDAAMTVVARVGRESGRWLARWTVLDRAGASEEWGGAYDTLDAALTAGIHELADREAQRFAVATGQARALRLQVAGVESLRDYGRVLNYVRGLNPVRSVQVEQVQGDTLTFMLRVEGDPEMLARVIAAGAVLRAQQGGVFGAGQSYVLVR